MVPETDAFAGVEFALFENTAEGASDFQRPAKAQCHRQRERRILEDVSPEGIPTGNEQSICSVLLPLVSSPSPLCRSGH